VKRAGKRVTATAELAARVQNAHRSLDREPAFDLADVDPTPLPLFTMGNGVTDRMMSIVPS
jgi:hypothetical protein